MVFKKGHKTRRLILEVFGRYLHKEDEVLKLIAHYNKYNFNCVIFWDDELKDIDELKLNNMIKCKMCNVI